MAERILRDGYVVIVRDEDIAIPVCFGQTLELVAGRGCAYDDEYIGLVSNYLDDVYEIEPTLTQLRKSGIISATSATPLILNTNDLNKRNIRQGKVCFTYNEYIVLEVGLLEIWEDEGIRKIDDLYAEICESYEDTDEDDVYYRLTDKGLEVLQEITEREEALKCVCEREESKFMDNLFGNLGFGKVKGDRFKLSMNGIAVAQSNGKYVVYNKDNNEFVDVSNMLFDIKDALFLLPAVEVNTGDTVLHEGKPYFVVDTTNEIKAVDYETCTQTVLIPKSTMFGIKYFIKVFSMFGDNFAATGDLFSNPMMLMALMEGSNSDLTQMMLFSSLSNGDLGSNPMALAMMLKGDKGNDSLSTIAMLSMLNNGTNPFAPKKKETKKINADK